MNCHFMQMIRVHAVYLSLLKNVGDESLVAPSFPVTSFFIKMLNVRLPFNIDLFFQPDTSSCQLLSQLGQIFSYSKKDIKDNRSCSIAAAVAKVKNQIAETFRLANRAF